MAVLLCVAIYNYTDMHVAACIHVDTEMTDIHQSINGGSSYTVDNKLTLPSKKHSSTDINN